jgi:hypothetical protein
LTESEGNAGNLAINASDSVIIEGKPSIGGLTTTSYRNGSSGNISLATETLNISDNGLILTSAVGEGNPGEISIEASEIKIFNSPDFTDAVLSEIDIFNSPDFIGAVFTGIGSGNPTLNPFVDAPTANGGEIRIDADSLRLENGVEISTVSTNQKPAGDIIIRLDGELRLSDGNISADSLSLSNQAIASSGGGIEVSADTIRLFGDSAIRAETASGGGEGGNITLSSDSILAFDDSDILAFSADGKGGNINLDTPLFLVKYFNPFPQLPI